MECRIQSRSRATYTCSTGGIGRAAGRVAARYGDSFIILVCPLLALEASARRAPFLRSLDAEPSSYLVCDGSGKRMTSPSTATSALVRKRKSTSLAEPAIVTTTSFPIVLNR